MTTSTESIVTARLNLLRTTKGTVLYRSVVENVGPIRTVYIQKDALEQPFPERISVEVHVVHEDG